MVIDNKIIRDGEVIELVDIGDLESPPYKYPVQEWKEFKPYDSGRLIGYDSAGSTTNDPRVDV